MNTVLVLESDYGLLIPDSLSSDLIRAVGKCKIVKLPNYGSNTYEVVTKIVPTVRLIDASSIEDTTTPPNQLERPPLGNAPKLAQFTESNFDDGKSLCVVEGNFQNKPYFVGDIVSTEYIKSN